MHQFDIERSDLLQDLCRNLRIVYLQNNLIGRIKNLSKLKDLRYLNLAVNNIRVVENLQACESLEKLDLTMNFIADLSSIKTLQNNDRLREIYLTGNPCTQTEHYRLYVIDALPQLTTLDGIRITRSERILATQCKSTLSKMHFEQMPIPSDFLPTSTTDGEKLYAHTPEARIEIAHEIALQRAKTDPVSRFKPAPPPTQTQPNFDPTTGRIMQKNELGLHFEFKESASAIELDVALSKFLDNSFVDVDLHAAWVAVVVKRKCLFLALPADIVVGESVALRSQLTGHLVLRMPRVKVEPLLVADRDVNSKESFTGYIAGTRKVEEKIAEKAAEAAPMSIKTVATTIAPPSIPDDFIDDPEVPPLM